MSSATVVCSVQHCITHIEVLAHLCRRSTTFGTRDLRASYASDIGGVDLRTKKNISFLAGKRQPIIRPSSPQPSHYFHWATRFFSQTYTIVNCKLNWCGRHSFSRDTLISVRIWYYITSAYNRASLNSMLYRATELISDNTNRLFWLRDVAAFLSPCSHILRKNALN
jgi:hypothetical protein